MRAQGAQAPVGRTCAKRARFRPKKGDKWAKSSTYSRISPGGQRCSSPIETENMPALHRYRRDGELRRRGTDGGREPHRRKKGEQGATIREENPPKRRPSMGRSREKSPLWAKDARNRDFSFRDAKNRNFSRQQRTKDAPIGGLAQRRPGKTPERPQGDPQKTRTRGLFSCEKSRFSSAPRPLEDERGTTRGRSATRGTRTEVRPGIQIAALGRRGLGARARLASKRQDAGALKAESVQNRRVFGLQVRPEG